MTAGPWTVEAPVFRGVGLPMSLEEVTVLPPRKGEVAVRLVAGGVCHSCLHSIDGTLEGTPLPIILGDEGAGVVAAVGEGVTDLEPGDHVVLSWAPSCGSCRECMKGMPARCMRKPAFGVLGDGETRFRKGDEAIFHYGPATSSPYVVVPSSGAIRIDKALPLEHAALIGCCVATGAGAVFNTARVETGQSVAVIGCGGVGLNAVHAASLAGASPIVAVDPVDLKLVAAERLGASALVTVTGDGMAEAVRAASGGGVDVAIVAVGSCSAIEQAVAALNPGGKCVVIGAPPTGAMLSIDPHSLRGQEKMLMGCSYGSCNPPVDFPKFVEMFLSGRFNVAEMVSHRYALAEINEAYANLAAGKDLRGLIVFDETED
ncbi:MAG TPA: Zn-dependent alcohol dehydrogenase [Acidimicrobiales bacterium]|nr:Zn-dependent alcohol dehydrogenase [Acidimicrobiales bacterium]